MPMLPPESFQFCGPSYFHNESVRIDAQKALNLYPEPGGPSSKSPMVLIGTPGLSLYKTLATTPVRELWAGSNRLFAVGGTHVYEITGATVDEGLMTGSAGAGPCQIVQGAGPPFDLLVMDSSNGKIYRVDPTGPTVTAVFDGIALEYMDGFFIAIAKPAAATQNQLNCSVAADGTTWPALNFARRTTANDRLNQLAAMNRILWVFGEKTIDHWTNVGNLGFPFAPIQGSALNIGCLAPFSVAKLFNSMIWLGADDRGYATVYRSRGLSADRVSTFALESILKLTPDIVNARAFAYQEEGHTFYVLNLTTLNRTFVYDATTNLWHERGYGTSGALGLPRIRQDCCASVLVTGDNVVRNYVGDYANGKVYTQALQYPDDDTATIRRVRTSPHVSDHNQRLRHARLEIDADVGTAQIALMVSSNGGQSYPLTYAAKPASNDLEVEGFGRFYWTQLGAPRDRVYGITIDSSTQLIRLIAGYLTVEK